MINDGDAYVKALAQHVRSHSKSFSDILGPRQTNWLGSPKSAVLLRLDPHHLYYLLLRFAEAGVPSESVGPVDVDHEALARPMSRWHLRGTGASMPEEDDGKSVFSAVTSIGSNWFGTSSSNLPLPADARFIYSSFTKLPALYLGLTAPPPSHRFIASFEALPDSKFVSLYAFKNLQLLVIQDLDPRGFLGWDALADSLRRLDIVNSGMEDISELIVDRVVEDAERHKGVARTEGRSTVASLPVQRWRQLRHLSLAANDLTFLPSEPFERHFTNLVHLDLSDNLLVAVPSGLVSLVSLRSLTLSNNMIDTLQGVYRHLGAIARLDLSRNRIESLAGLDRLFALESINVSSNRLYDASEVDRLAVLPNLLDLSLGDNPFTETIKSWRIGAFSAFALNGRDPSDIKIDGVLPSYNEKRSIAPVKTTVAGHGEDNAPSSPVKRVGPQPEGTKSPSPLQLNGSAQPVASTSKLPSLPTRTPSITAQTQTVQSMKKKRKSRRIVNLDAPVLPTTRAQAADVSLKPDSSTSERSATNQSRPHVNDGSLAEDPGGTSEAEAAAFRKRIEALRSETGTSWLSIYAEQEARQT